LKYLIDRLVRDALAALPPELHDITPAAAPVIERTRDSAHGDFSTNAALQLAKAAKRKPREPSSSGRGTALNTARTMRWCSNEPQPWQ